METPLAQCEAGKQSHHSDPTYEAWKQVWGEFYTLPIYLHSDPTYEAWKPSFNKDLMQCSDILRSYLWGMETKHSRAESPKPEKTPILPMRHGNWLIGHICSFVKGITPILPMRHGNLRFCMQVENPLSRLRSYLWGMETSTGLWRAPLFWILRSYLWGMETIHDKVLDKALSLLRSYLWGMETLKYGFNRWVFFSLRSYLWGMETLQVFHSHYQKRLDSDPTYEAWKHHFNLSISTGKIPTPILPMRHGNRRGKEGLEVFQKDSDPTYEAWKQIFIFDPPL